MTILKIQKEDRSQFVIFSKTVLEIPNLSWEAKGLWAYLMSKPISWEISVAHLTKHFPAKKDKIYKCLQDLNKHGVCESFQPRKTLPNGKIVADKVQYIIYEVPQDKELKMSKNKYQLPENQETDNQITDNPPQVSNDIEIRNESKKKPITLKRVERDAFGEVVRLSKEEYQKAKELCGDALEDLIDQMNDHCEAHSKKYSNYLAAIRIWWKRRAKDQNKKEDKVTANVNWAIKFQDKMGKMCKFEAFSKYVEFRGYGNAPSLVIHYNENGFKEQVLNQTRKMGLIHLWEAE